MTRRALKTAEGTKAKGVDPHADPGVDQLPTAYPCSFVRHRAAWREFSGFSPRRFRVFHDTNRQKVPYIGDTALHENGLVEYRRRA